MTESKEQPAVQGGGAQADDDELPWWAQHHPTLETLAFALGGTAFGTSVFGDSGNAKFLALVGACALWWLGSRGRRLEYLDARMSEVESSQSRSLSALAIVHELAQVNANLVGLREDRLAEGQRGGLGSSETPKVEDSVASG